MAFVIANRVKGIYKDPNIRHGCQKAFTFKNGFYILSLNRNKNMLA